MMGRNVFTSPQTTLKRQRVTVTNVSCTHYPLLISNTYKKRLFLRRIQTSSTIFFRSIIKLASHFIRYCVLINTFYTFSDRQCLHPT